MGYEKEQAPEGAKANVCVVEATDEHGRVVARDAFPSEAEAEAHAAGLRAKGYRVEQSSLAPKAPEALGSP